MREDGKTKIRLGLRLVSGLGEDVGRRIEAVREEAFRSASDLVQRAAVERKERMALAESGALDGLEGGRREAIWSAVAPRDTELFEGTHRVEQRPSLRPLTRAEQLVLDYERTGVSIADHPMKLLRPTLPKRCKTSRDVMTMKAGVRVVTAGLVICRQRPGT